MSMIVSAPSVLEYSKCYARYCQWQNDDCYIAMFKQHSDITDNDDILTLNTSSYQHRYVTNQLLATPSFNIDFSFSPSIAYLTYTGYKILNDDNIVQHITIISDSQNYKTYIQDFKSILQCLNLTNQYIVHEIVPTDLNTESSINELVSFIHNTLDYTVKHHRNINITSSSRVSSVPVLPNPNNFETLLNDYVNYIQTLPNYLTLYERLETCRIINTVINIFKPKTAESIYSLLGSPQYNNPIFTHDNVYNIFTANPIL